MRKTLQEEEKQRLVERLSELQAAPAALTAPQGNPADLPPNVVKDDWFDSAKKRFEVVLLGDVREDPKDFIQRLVVKPQPDYPPLARTAGVQGRVVLQVRVKADGTVSVERILEGQPVLADAATAAVQKWRAKPEQVNGKAVEVVSTVSFDFQLR
jgi:TonB family protein